MKNPVINIDQVEDVVVNKALYPLFCLKKAREQGIITTGQIELSAQNLQDLIEWVYSLRG